MATRGQVMRGEVKETLKNLKAKVAALQRQARDLQERVERMGATGCRKPHAVVDRTRCTGCGLCGEICPVAAIRVTYVANIDAGRCTGCGTCVQNCPQGAIHLTRGATTPAEEPRSA